MNLSNFIIPPWVKWVVPAFALLSFGLWAWRIDSLRAQYKTQLSECRADKAQFTAAIQDRTSAELSRQKGITDVADTKHKIEAPAIRAATDRFIADNRVRRQEASDGSSATSSGTDTGVPEEVSADSLVAVADSDVQACSGATKYAVDAHNWTIDLAGGVK